MPADWHEAGRVIFMIPVCRPRLPVASDLLRYLARIDSARYYTNHGPLVEELQDRLCEHFGLKDGAAVLASSGTAGLVGAVLATAGRARSERPLAICPAFTFVATAIAAVSCGFEPFFVDVDVDTWAIDPKRLLRLPELPRAGVVIPVAPMGRSPALDAWTDFQAETGIPVVMDAAACFDTLEPIELGRCSFPVVVSLHATKTFSTAEGGLVLCAVPRLAPPVARALNFGFFDSRESVGPSTNGKLSEYHAAVGLADLDGWQGKRQGFVDAARVYRSVAKAHGLADRIVVDTDHANPYAHYLASCAEDADGIMDALNAAGIEARRWYGRGLHHQPAFADPRPSRFPVTDALSARLVGLPFASDADRETISRILQVVSGAVDLGAASGGLVRA